ncbi:hypothetical protein ONZ45_g12384 [Pleurotus djamor]|nr:hypothetical protein ONZ45_g19300 [Pleurotus djamor]KAJ8496643.1 hypothetical protein ONZ45_g12384 [Pleurotus djamor]
MAISTDFYAQSVIDGKILEYENAVLTLKLTTRRNTPQSVIDQAILEHETAIYALKKRRNTYAAISQLPTDVFTYIFLMIKPDDDEDTMYHQKWLQGIQRVCCYWKEVAVSTPQLWSNIYISDDRDALRFAGLMFERLKEAPFSLKLVRNLDNDSEEFLSLSRRVFTAMERVQELEISSDFPVAEMFGVILPSEAPGTTCLRSLVINIEGPEMVMAHRDTPSIISAFNLSALRMLTLGEVSLPQICPIMPHLQELRIYNTDDRYGPTISWLYGVLSSTPHLQYLSVQCLFLDRPNHPFPVGPKLQLRKLKRLHLYFEDPSLSTFFDHLNMPSSTVIVATMHDDPIRNPLNKCVGPLSRLLSRFSDSHAYKVEITFPSLWDIKADDGKTLMYLDLPDPYSDEHMRAYGDLLQSLSPIPTCVSFFSRAQTYHTSIPSIALRSLPRIHTACFHDVVGHLDDQVSPLLALLRALLMLPDDNNSPPCPELKYLEFPGARRIKQTDQQTIDAIMAVLRQRREIGIPIEEVFVPLEGLREWKAHFGLEWEGILSVISL